MIDPLEYRPLTIDEERIRFLSMENANLKAENKNLLAELKPVRDGSIFDCWKHRVAALEADNRRLRIENESVIMANAKMQQEIGVCDDRIQLQDEIKRLNGVVSRLRTKLECWFTEWLNGDE